MTLYEKRQRLRGLKSAFNKLSHHLLDLRSKVADLTEEIRQEELEIYIQTTSNAITYIPEGTSTTRRTPADYVRSPPSSKSTKKYLDYISTLSKDSKRELLNALRTKSGN